MRQFRVIDGQYRSTPFSTIEEAREDAMICIQDEGYSGCVEIYEWDDEQGSLGRLVERVDDDGYGQRNRGIMGDASREREHQIKTSSN
jgi:hypothetical protein